MNIPKGSTDFHTREHNCEREGLKEMPEIWTTFSHSLAQKKSESFFPEATKQQDFIFIESDKEEEDGETWATVSLSNSTETSCKGSRLGNLF